MKNKIKRWLVAIGTAVGLFVMYRIFKLKLSDAESKAEFYKRAEKASELEGRVTELRKQMGDKHEVVKRLDKELRATRREAVEVVERTKGLNDKEVLSRFRNLYRR